MPETESLELRNLSTSIMSDTRPNIVLTTNNRPPYYGVLLATLSSLFFSLCSVIVKSLSEINPIELAMFRFIGLLPAIPIVLYKQEAVFPEGKRILLLLRSFVGASSLICSFYAFRYMELGDASTILFSTPVFVAIFARLFLREPCGWFNIGTIALTLLGIIFITTPKAIFGGTDTMPPEPGTHTLGNKANSLKYMFGPITAAFCGTLFGANAYVLLRVIYVILRNSFQLTFLVSGVKGPSLFCDYDKLWTVFHLLHIHHQLLLRFLHAKMWMGSLSYTSLSII